MNGISTRELRHMLYVHGVQNNIVFVDVGDEHVYIVKQVTHEPLDDGGNLTIRCEDFDISKNLDPLVSMDNRAVVAENMLDTYHLLKTNLKTREAIHRALHDRGASQERTQTAYQQVVQAQAELDQCKYEILELMGVDS